MSAPILEFEGTAEEIQGRFAAFNGRRLRVTVQSLECDVATQHSDITHRIVERFRYAPAEERAKVPSDLTDNLDAYIYGLPNE